MGTKPRDPEVEALNSLDIRHLAERLGFVRDRSERNKFRRGDASVHIDDQLFRSFKPGFENLHGRGAISFVEQVEGIGFREALSELRQVVGRPDLPSLPPVAPAPRKRKAPLQRPSQADPAGEARERAYAYLCGEAPEGRCLPRELVDREVEAGRLYFSDALGGCAVWVLGDAAGRPAAYECHLLDGSRRKLFSTGSRKGEAAFVVPGDAPGAAFFEGIIDLLSYEALGLANGARPTLVAFCGSVTPDHPVAKLHPGPLVGFDQEPEPIRLPDGREVYPGDEMAAPFLAAGGTRLELPAWARGKLKDWNEALQNNPQHKEGAEMSSKQQQNQQGDGKRPFRSNVVRGVGLILDKNFKVLESMNFGGRAAVSGWLDFPTQKTGIKFLAVGNTATEIINRYETTPPDAPLEVDFFGGLNVRKWQGNDGKNHEEFYLRLSNVRDVAESQEYGISLSIYGNVGRIDDTPKGIKVFMINHERVSEEKEFETPMSFFLSGDDAAAVRNAGVGSYIGLKGTIQRVGHDKAGGGKAYYTNVIAEKVDVVRTHGQAEQQAQREVEAPAGRRPVTRGGAVQGRAAAPQEPASYVPARGGAAAPATGRGSRSQAAPAASGRGSRAQAPAGRGSRTQGYAGEETCDFPTP
jgi:hypothetical protein